ncbi:MAG TPA: phosphodiester glycosidase family protein [Pyrinomonadaceae bacterium]
MKFIRAFLFIALAILPASSQEFKTVRDGVEYAQFAGKIKPSEKETARTATVNALRLDLKKARLDVVHALDAAIGVETTSSISRRHGAFAAINAGFFRLDRSIFNGEAAGVLKIDHKLLSESFANRIAFFISNRENQTAIAFAHLEINGSVEIKNKTFRLSGINRQRKDDDIIEFTSEFHRTTLTDNSGLEIIIRNGKIAAISDRKGSSLIPENGYVISAGAKMREQLLPVLKIGNKVKLSSGVLHKGNDFPTEESNRTAIAFSTAEDIVGGVPQLIKNGKIEITWEQEKSSKSFVETRHPRTAIARIKDGRALLVTVDGRSETSAGMSLQELAEMLLEMGATDAMNLDGGGSTTMVLEGKVVNRPSDKEGERPVSDAILVTLRK